VGAFLPAPEWRSLRSTSTPREGRMSILWIILIVILVLALLGFFSRGYW
jgi:flagellar basal body-associated protein FliL